MQSPGPVPSIMRPAPFTLGRGSRARGQKMNPAPKRKTVSPSSSKIRRIPPWP